jgi:hypothetical protein
MHVVIRRDLSNAVLHVEYEHSDTTREPIRSLLDYLANWKLDASEDGLSETRKDNSEWQDNALC